MKYKLKSSAPSPSFLDFDRDLNPQQRAVVEAAPQKILVLAGAGSGKTRTLTYRVARLAAGGCPPERIMLVTFTNRAAQEMVARVENILGPAMRKCAAGTFHHVGNRVLRQYAPALGLAPDFTILDPEDTQDLLRAVIAEEGLATLTSKRFPQPKVVSSMISMSRGSCKKLAEVLFQRYPKFVEQQETLERVALRFESRKRQRNLCDFDDLLAHWHRLLTDPELAPLAEELRSAYDHVLVDEYQDINALQGQLVDEMSREHQSLTCVGDDAQSIYSFRGADFQQILDFPVRHPDAQILKLTINYRSTPDILSLANRSIQKNRQQHQKELVPFRKVAGKPAVVPLRDVFQQAEFVAQRVLELHHEQTLPLRKIAVLYRNHAHSLELQVELSRRQIPYAIRSGMRFFEQAHIKDIVAFLRARENNRDSLAWSRMLRLWPGIGTQSAERFALHVVEQSGPWTQASLQSELESFGQSLRGRGKQGFSEFSQFWRALSAPEQNAPGAAISYILRTQYADHIERNWDNPAARKEDIEHLAGYAERFADAQSFLSELSLVSGVSAEQVVGAEEPDDMLVLSTIHQSKGLEWAAVFVLSLVDGRFPMAQSLNDPAQLAEERRLFYVASTRAEDELYFCYPIWMDEKKQERPRLQRISRFLAEIDHAPPVFDRWEIEEEPAQS